MAKRARRTKNSIGRKILAASVITGAIAAFTIYSACSFARCPYLGRNEYALAFFALGFAMSYALKTAVLSSERKL